VMESLTKMTACWAPANDLEIFSDSASASIQIAAEDLPRSVKWNNRQVATKYDGRTNLVSLHI